MDWNAIDVKRFIVQYTGMLHMWSYEITFFKQ